MSADIVTVYDKDGNEARVSREWLERWPDDFTEQKPVTKTASAASKASGGKTKEITDGA